MSKLFIPLPQLLDLLNRAEAMKPVEKPKDDESKGIEVIKEGEDLEALIRQEMAAPSPSDSELEAIDDWFNKRSPKPEGDEEAPKKPKKGDDLKFELEE